MGVGGHPSARGSGSGWWRKACFGSPCLEQEVELDITHEDKHLQTSQLLQGFLF